MEKSFIYNSQKYCLLRFGSPFYFVETACHLDPWALIKWPGMDPKIPQGSLWHALIKECWLMISALLLQ